ncbi:hypothetical protein [Paraburkholderia rhynchosiae]|uniref:Uncharacterized protein n=1 Tax=Paraburkholderia rhynchosiae TaxID=487049 RepID=A0A2N7VU42_9BURK|nr:hypothetical protein [Paraburkholderia rhynchosiae]PMS20663.1 hypothetical protein C0Z16_34335 [Paraburkholderia rhynchosiae]CAB3726210.1 hypothetical protein LMG27174_05390 [Paraburkholderia rhynchosiae]
MQQFDITVPTVGSFVVHAPGRYIKYMSGSNGGGDASLVLTPGAQGGNKIRLAPGFAYRVADDQPMPDSWTLQNAAGGAPIIGQVVIGNGKIDDSTVQGVVQMVDGGKVRALNNSAYSGYAGGPAGAGVYAQAQLWNPVGSNTRLVLESITSLGAQTTSAMLFTDSTAALATLAQAGQPKLLGGAAGVGQVRTGTVGATPPANPTVYVIGAVGGGLVQSSVKPNEPIVIPPGHGLLITGNVANNSTSQCFEWYEEPNV